MTTAMCFGTFDQLHAGHAFFLRAAKQHGDRLMVVIARDATVEQVKGKKPQQSEEVRLRTVAQHADVDEAILGNPGDKLAIVVEHKPDIICLGYDQQAFTDNLQRKLAAHGVHPKIVRLPSFQPEIYKSSKLRENSDSSA